MKFHVILGMLALVLGACSLTPRGSQVPPAEARQLVLNGAKLVDVRTPGEFAAGHVAGAVNVPVQILDAHLAELGAKDAPIVVYCHSGARSSQAASKLKAAGFQRVYDLGGMSRWADGP